MARDCVDASSRMPASQTCSGRVNETSALKRAPKSICWDSSMDAIGHLNLIHFLDFYFTFFFFAGSLRRIGQYQSIARLAVSGPGRWPRLLKLVSEHRSVFLTWATVLPALLTLMLTLIQI